MRPARSRLVERPMDALEQHAGGSRRAALTAQRICPASAAPARTARPRGLACPCIGRPCPGDSAADREADSRPTGAEASGSALYRPRSSRAPPPGKHRGRSRSAQITDPPAARTPHQRDYRDREGGVYAAAYHTTASARPTAGSRGRTGLRTRVARMHAPPAGGRDAARGA